MTDTPPSPRSEQPQRRELSVGKKAIFALVMTVTSILALEGALRLAGWPSGVVRAVHKARIADEATFERSLGMWQPGFRGTIAWPIAISYELQINELGFRGPELAREKAEGEFRILCIGDSTTFAVYVDNDEAWPQRLEAALREEHPKVTVINGGHPAWSTADELRFLRERAIEVHPDLILHLFCDNDPAGIVVDDSGVDIAGAKGEYAHQLAVMDEGLSFADQLRFHTAIGEAQTRLHIAWKASREENRNLNIEPPEISEAAWGAYEAVYAELAAFCEARGVPLVTACFPQIKEHEEPAKRAETRVAAIAARHGVPFIPLAESFRAAEARGEALYWLPVDSHANVAGNAIIARELAAALRSRAIGPYRSEGERQ